MLSLKRKPKQLVDIFIKGELVATVTNFGKTTVLGFEGQPDVVFRRRELTERIEREERDGVAA